MHKPYSTIFRDAGPEQVEEIKVGGFSVYFGGSDSIMSIRRRKCKADGLVSMIPVYKIREDLAKITKKGGRQGVVILFKSSIR